MEPKKGHGPNFTYRIQMNKMQQDTQYHIRSHLGPQVLGFRSFALWQFSSLLWKVTHVQKDDLL